MFAAEILPPPTRILLDVSAKTAEFAFASVVSNRDIQYGEILSEKNIWVRRPGTGDFRPEHYPLLIGKRLKKNIKKNTQIKKNHIA